MKRSLLMMCALIASMMSFTSAMADDDKNIVAVVNIQQIMRESTAANSVREQLESKQKSFQAEIKKKEEALQKEDKELGEKRNVLSKDAFAAEAQKFRVKATEMQKEVQAKKVLLDNGFESALSDIQKAVNDIIKDMAKEKGFALALPTSQVMYYNESMDISDEVLKRLNKKLPKLTVKFSK